MSSPCAECPHRKLMCHDKCAEYLAYHDERLAAKNVFRGKHEADDFIITMTIKRRKGAHLCRK